MGFVKVSSRGTGNALLVHNHLALLAFEDGVVEKAGGVKKGSRDCVIDGLQQRRSYYVILGNYLAGKKYLVNMTPMSHASVKCGSFPRRDTLVHDKL